MITISTSGDFQRKWQANRIAAAELERTGYEFLEKDGAEARSYLAAVGPILLRRHLAIVGGSEQRKAPAGGGQGLGRGQVAAPQPAAGAVEGGDRHGAVAPIMACHLPKA